MRQLKTVLFILTLSLTAMAQSSVPAQRLTPASPKPLPQQISDLQKQIADQNANIKMLKETLRVQMQFDADNHLQVMSLLRRQSLAQGAGIGAGAMLLVCGVILRARRNNGATKPQARAAWA